MVDQDQPSLFPIKVSFGLSSLCLDWGGIVLRYIFIMTIYALEQGLGFLSEKSKDII